MAPKAKKETPEADRELIVGQGDYNRCDNKVVSARYTLWNFLPIAISEQFRRFANVYFLVVGGIMFVGQYTTLFDTAISPWTTLGPLAMVIAISLAVEALSDYKRHVNDHETNNADCTILARAANEGDTTTPAIQRYDPAVCSGKPVVVTDGGRAVGFSVIARKDIRQGHFVLVKNREMVPADLVLLASSNDQGGAYIETSSIDGETNLKLRMSANIIKKSPAAPAAAASGRPKAALAARVKQLETIQEATVRVASFSSLVHPSSVFPAGGHYDHHDDSEVEHANGRNNRSKSFRRSNAPKVAILTTEPPNASVHTFSGKLTVRNDNGDDDEVIPLSAEHIVLRGAVIRNTEWVIGLACFTGVDTKLVRNSFDTPSKFSQLDKLINQTVLVILLVMMLCIFYLATKAVYVNKDSFDQLFYAGYNLNATAPWPYLPDTLDPPKWNRQANNFLQFFFMYVTLLNNLIPLSLYVTVEMVQFVLVWMISADLDMYDDTTDTRALARSTIVSDLGRVEYIFSDKTGTLTQNVMRFKRCSVDGLIFGAPVVKHDDDSPFHPSRQLLVGCFKERPGSATFSAQTAVDTGEKLTFNAEMFLRVMSLCHTVVVEKDIDKKKEGIGAPSPAAKSAAKTPSGKAGENAKNSDGAPMGFAYQAESPDEGALVSAASSNFGFQVISRDSSGIRLRRQVPSHLDDLDLVRSLQSGECTMGHVAMETAHGRDSVGADAPNRGSAMKFPLEETWTILATNKFDSDRKRMSILLRAPSELGSVPILFCKGADSAMLDSEICGITGIGGENGNDAVKSNTTLSSVPEDQEMDEDMEHLLRMQVHLGEFAKEGLRTLVLGMKILSDSECTMWLALYNSAASSMSNREELMKKAAVAIERDLHIVGATAIEDKLQHNVPQTIATLGKAGIKLWVLTGDKRETAVEIGYSTNVLTEKMHLTEVPDNGKDHVRTQVAMEFMRLIKIGRLPGYQMSVLEGKGVKTVKFKQTLTDVMEEISFVLGKVSRRLSRMKLEAKEFVYHVLGFREQAQRLNEELKELNKAEKSIARDVDRRRVIRQTADQTIKAWLQSEEGQKHRRKTNESKEDIEVAMASEDAPEVFLRAESANVVLQNMANAGKLSQPELRELSMAHLTAHQVGTNQPGEFEALVDEDTLSLDTFVPGSKGDKVDFDRRKRTLLEQLFAVDRKVRKGQLRKHMNAECRAALAEDRDTPAELEKQKDLANDRNAVRALVIEGAALKHLLGDPEFEEILFAVAKNCDAVIACRVSPRQKAQLVNLVRENVRPEPITLAIGDGANDVGMIQEAHVGIGISGKEGKQAVNASDFAIAQFRFLETLVLIHGRWNFFRLSTVVLFSFYKNAVMAGTIIWFTERSLYSGTPLFDEWIVAMLNFVAAAPIVFLGIFDRCLSKDYVRKNPEVYADTRENQLITIRGLVRWIVACMLHVNILYYFTVPQQSYGGGITPAFRGLMRNEDADVPGDGEGGDIKSVGTVTFTSMIFLLSYKVLYESKSLVHGQFPWCTFQKDGKGGCGSRLSYTWIGVTFLSILFYLWAIAVYQLVGLFGANQFSGYVLTTNHVLATRSLSWVLILFIPIIGMVADVIMKTFANMFFPTQTQIHLEAEAMAKIKARSSSSSSRDR